MIECGERIKELRKETRLSQRAFGEKIGITGSSVNKLESGENKPSDQTIKLICREFNVDQAWLETGEGEMFHDDNDELNMLIDTLVCGKNNNARAIFKALAKKSETEWEMLAQFILDAAKNLSE